jgi:hypothetical protein
MKTFFTKFFNAPWYPLAISAYPILGLLSANAGQVQLVAAIRPLLVSIAFGMLLFLCIWLIFKQTHKAAFLTTLFLILFFSYGHIYIAIDEQWPDTDYSIWLNVLWIILFFLAIFWVSRPKVDFVSASATFNTVALALVIIAAAQLDFGSKTNSIHRVAAENAPVQEELIRPENSPDVYFFLLDSYTRSDLLQSVYGFDNSPFETELGERGFYIPMCSQSNYVRTEISLGSSLNMQYLQELDPAFTPESTARKKLWDALQHNAVRYNFETLGYETINFATGFAWMEIRDSDHFMSPPPTTTGISEFEGLFLQTTLARYAKDFGWVDPDAIMATTYRDRFNYVFDNIDQISKMPQPTFSYIHIISPHPPFVFDADGNPTHPADFWNDQGLYPASLYKKGYLNQLQYLNKKMIEAVDVILKNSETPPVIIIEGDHGPWLQPKEKRMLNFEAVLLPGHNDLLYPTLTPVNIFRFVFNAYFGGKYDILEDISYFSPVPKLYDFSVIPNHCGEQ